MTWLSTTLLNQGTAPAASTVVDLLGFFTVGEKRSLNGIRRLIVDMSWVGSAANVDIAARIGVIQVSDDSLAGGVVPDPLTDPTAGWLMNEGLLWDEPNLEQARQHWDLKVPRRLDGARNTFAFMLENSVSSGGNINWYLSVRALLTWR